MPWGPVLVFASAGFLTMTTSLMTAGLLPLMAVDLGVSEGVAGTLTSGFALAIVVTILPLTRWSLRFSRRTVLVGATCLMVLGNVLVALAPSLAPALAGRFLSGIAHGLLGGGLAGVVVRVVPPERVPQALGLVLAGNSAGLAVGAPLAAVLGAGVGWRGAFAVAAVLGLVLAGFLLRITPTVHIDASASGSIGRTIRTPGVLRMAISWAGVLLGHYATLTFIAPLFVALGGSPDAVGLPLLVLGLTGIAGVLLAGRIPLDRAVRGAVVFSGLVALAFVTLALSPPMGLVYAALVVWGAASAASLLMNQQTVLTLGHRGPELALGLGILTTQFGVVLGASLGGLTLETLGAARIPVVSAAAIGLSLLLLLGMPALLRRARAEQRDGGPSAR
jgi:predicted MFS family arabinose efflux permease